MFGAWDGNSVQRPGRSLLWRLRATISGRPLRDFFMLDFET